MPVIDHAVHEQTKVSTATYRWDCHNKPRIRPPVTVQTGWTENGNRITEKIDDFGSPECRHDTSLIDWFCKDCQWIGSGEEYARSVQMRAKLQNTVRPG